MRAMVRVDELRAALLALPQVQLAVLFGSSARGTATAASDVDLGLLLTGAEAAADAVHRTLRGVAGDRCDVTDLRVAPPLLRFEIAREGVLLVERDPGAWADFRARAMIDWWDFAPLARMIAAAAAARLRQADTHGPA